MDFSYNSLYLNLEPVMSYYIYLYIISISISFFGGWLVWRSQRDISGFFFLVFTIFSSLWFLIYFLFFSGIFSGEMLLKISRTGFWTGVVTVYSLLLYIYYFGVNDKKILQKKVIAPLVILLGVFCIYFFTDFIIYGLEYDSASNVYREILGSFFILHIILHSVFLFLFCLFSFQRVKDLKDLNKIRLKNILLSVFIPVFGLIVLQLILPYFGIWILEKEIIFLFTGFVISVAFNVRRYYFSDIGYGIGKLLIASLAIVLTFALSIGIKYFFLNISSSQFGYWIIKDEYSFFDNISFLILYFPIYKYLYKIFLGNDRFDKLSSQIQLLKKSISLITNTQSLNTLIQHEMQKIFKAKNASIVLYDETGFQELRKHFNKKNVDRIFINDIVYLEHNKDKFDIKKIQSEIPSNAFFIFPLYNTSGYNIGIFILGSKRFGDFYTLMETEILKEFSFFLEIHLKYIRTYVVMEDLSKNLDQKVDEKTIEYNDLINKQKEFISVISHEIKSPIASAIFQSDSIIDDIGNKTLSEDELKNELTLLNAQLVRTGGLLTKLFSVQYYDTHKVNLFREKVEFSHFMEHEIELFSHMHSHITFTSDIAPDIGFVEIDKIQFQQVISSLLDNAVKFIDKVNDPTIAIVVEKKDKKLIITLEDNGNGFQGIQIKDIFDKYTTGKKGTVGLGMGLYLCKTIISMHNGTIEAAQSLKYGGAKFVITLPVK